MSLRVAITGSAAVLGLAVACPSPGAVTFYNSAGPVQPEENVLLDSGAVGTTIFGATNQTGTRVLFRSLSSGVQLESHSNGQARIEAVGGLLDSVAFSLADGGGFGEVEFLLHQGGGRADGNVTVTLAGSFAGGQASQTFSLTNGNNWFAARTTDGDFITSVSVTTDNGVDDLRQVRLGGFLAAAPVPEPATWAMMLGGFGLLGAAVRRRRLAFA